MKAGNIHFGLKGLRRSVGILAATALTLGAAAASKAALVFDNVSNFRNAAAGASGTSTGTTPNTFMGDGYTLLSGTTSITGFDLYPVNNSGTAFAALRLTIYVWGTVNTTGTVSATTPAFSNLLASYTVTSTITGGFANGTYLAYESATPGVNPGLALGAPLVPTGNTVGLTFAYQGSTDGTNFASVNSLTSLITYGTPATVGSNVFNGYYRNANSETDGNFTSALRSLGVTNQGLAVRVYGNVVPEPGTWALLAAGGVVGLLAVRRRAGAARAA